MFWKTKNPAGAGPAKRQANDLSPALSGSFDSGQSRKKVLLVEDDPITAKVLTAALNKGGYQVFCAEDGAGAIAIVRDNKPDAMVVDVDLPPDISSYTAGLYDGFQVTRWLQITRRVPTIIISGSNKSEYRQKAVAAGAREFMAKPVDYSRLLSSISSALNDQQQRSAGTGFVDMRLAS